MKYYELDKEEKDLVASFEKGGLKRVRDMKKVVINYTAIARATLGRTKNINIRISERDIQKLKAKAAKKGIPYQTLVSSVLHQYGAE